MNILTFDLETTGFDPNEDEIIEVGFAVHDEDMTKQSEGGCLVQPDKRIPDEVVHLTGITNEKVKKEGHPWPAVRSRFREYLRNCDVWCAHNASFDMGFLSAHMNDTPSPEYVVDTLRVSERFVPAYVLHSNKLEDIAHFFGVSLQNAHRAVEDALATANLLDVMMEEIGLSLEDLLGAKPVKLGKYHIGEDPIEALYSGLSGR